MTDFEVRYRSLDKEARATLAEVTGAIDTATLEEFQASMEEIRKGGSARIVLDLSKVRFINSTALGYLVKVNDRLKDDGGGIALIRVPAKVRLVIEMLGLNTYFSIRDNEDDALFALGMSTEGAGRPQQMPAAPAAVDTCGTCGLLLSLPEPGSYRCPRCFTGVICSEDGEASFWVPDEPPPIVLTFPCTPEAIEGLVGYVLGYLKKLGYPQERVRDLEGGIREVGRALQEEIHEHPDSAVCHLRVQTEAMSVSLEFSDAGKTLAPEVAQAAFKRAREVSDEFSWTPHPLGGNIIRLTKRK
ncbi:MAG: STAS domain-containing protein [Planctomycetota bacterium]|nr:STAS domain-containing protein [Planctomycetota bacterium]